MEKKLTDKEIVKALKCLLELVLVEGCLQRAKTISKALDLINRLQADKEGLINGQETLQKYITTLQAENERLKNTLDDVLDRQPILVERSEKYAKAEAYKEFAEKVCDEITDAIINNGKVIKERIEKHNVNRLEDNFCCMCDGKIMALGGIEYFIKNLLKELTGE